MTSTQESEEAREQSERGRTGLFRVQPLLRDYYAVARSSALGKKPIRVLLWGRPFVLYRGTNAEPVALLDRCPHRNVPLSEGRVREDGQLECPYHGWCFDGSGRCTEIPGRVLPLTTEYRVPRYSVRESQGFVWLCPSESGPLSEPFLLPHWGEDRYTTVIREVSAEASLYAVIENALDVPHTSILHRGLFRGGARNRVEVTVRRAVDRVELEYRGEPPPRGVLARVLSLGSTTSELTVQHWDRFFLPSVLQVEYRLGDSVHFVVTGLCVPVQDHETRMFAVASFRTPLPGPLVARLLEPLGRWVFGQDARLLKKQTENVLRFSGEQFIHTELDAMGPELWRVLRAAARREQEGLVCPQPSDFESERRFELDA